MSDKIEGDVQITTAEGNGAKVPAGDAIAAGLVVHAGDDYLLPIHPTPAGEGVAVAFRASGVTCERCLATLRTLDAMVRGGDADRRQLAIEAGLDAAVHPDRTPNHVARMIETAVDAALRVRVSVELERAMLLEVDRVGMAHGGMKAGLSAAFRAAGFEVLE